MVFGNLFDDRFSVIYFRSINVRTRLLERARGRWSAKPSRFPFAYEAYVSLLGEQITIKYYSKGVCTRNNAYYCIVTSDTRRLTLIQQLFTEKT